MPPVRIFYYNNELSTVYWTLLFMPHLLTKCFVITDLLNSSFWPHCTAGGIFVFPDQRSNLRPLHWNHKVLTTGRQGSPWFFFFNVLPWQFNCSSLTFLTKSISLAESHTTSVPLSTYTRNELNVSFYHQFTKWLNQNRVFFSVCALWVCMRDKFFLLSKS